MNRTVHEEIRAENLHFANEINARQLEQYHGMLNAFNTQATLIVGFALATLGADFLTEVGSHSGEFCAFKDTEHKAVGLVLILMVTSCIGISIVVTSCASYLLQKSHEAALRIGASAAVARTHSWLMSGTPTGNSVDDLLGQLSHEQMLRT